MGCLAVVVIDLILTCRLANILQVIRQSLNINQGINHQGIHVKRDRFSPYVDTQSSMYQSSMLEDWGNQLKVEKPIPAYADTQDWSSYDLAKFSDYL